MKKMKSGADTEKHFPQWLGEKGTYVYVLVMLVFFALFYTNKMFNVVDDKRRFF